MAGYEIIDYDGDKPQKRRFKNKDALIDYLIYEKLGNISWRKL